MDSLTFSVHQRQHQQLIERATAETLISPDWALNMEVCDLSNAAPEWYVCVWDGSSSSAHHSQWSPNEKKPDAMPSVLPMQCPQHSAGTTHTIDSAQDAVKALKARLKSSNPKVLMLTLALLEAVIKNGSASVHGLVGSRDFLPSVGALTEGKQGWDVREAALKLLQECGLAFEGQKDRLFFYPYYMELRLSGKQFAQLQASSPVFSPPPQPGAESAVAASTAAEADDQGDFIHWCG